MSPIEVNPAAEASLTAVSAPVVRPEHAEGELARLIEQQTAKIPSDWYLFAAGGSVLLALALELAGRHRTADFVSHWPSPLLIAGIYNKLVKTLGTR
jgi:hypothetical protein